MVRRLTEPRASRYTKQLNEPRRILVTVSDALYMAIWQKASQLQMSLSTVANLILSNEIDWHYRSPTVAAVPPPPPPPQEPVTSSIPAADRQFYDWVMAEKRDLTPEQQARYNDVSHRLSEERRNSK